MKFRDLSMPGIHFRICGDVSRSLLRRQWSIDRRGNGYNATFCGGLLAGKPTWIEEDKEIQQVNIRDAARATDGPRRTGDQ